MTQAVPLAHTQMGEQHPVSLYILHGLFGSSSNWRSIARTLSERYHVVLSDARNHGESTWNPRMDYPSMADDVQALIENTAHERVIVMGHSMGGKTAMTLAVRQSIAINKLVVVDIAPIDYLNLDASKPADSTHGAGEDHAGIIRSLRNLDLANVKDRKSADSALQATIANAGIRQFLLQNLVKHSDNDSYRWRLNLDAIQQNLTILMQWPPAKPGSPITASTAIATLFIRGANSKYVDESYHQQINTLFSSCQIQSIDNAGHWPHAEQPGAFLDTLKPFLKA